MNRVFKKLVLPVILGVVLVIPFLVLLLYGFADGVLYMSDRLMARGCVNFAEEVEHEKLEPKNPGLLRFVAVGDTADYETPKTRTSYLKVASAIREKCNLSGCDFIVFLGDNFFPDGVHTVEDPIFEEYIEKPYKNLNVPIYAVLGNHDESGSLTTQLLYTMKSDIWKFPNYFYSINTELADFNVINTECNLMSYMRLDDIMDGASTDKWQFVFAHRPVYSKGGHGDHEIQIRWYWDYKFSERVDFYVSGHNHNLEHSAPYSTGTDFIISGAGAISNYSGENRIAKKTPAEPVFMGAGLGFTYFQVTKNKASVDFYNTDLDILYSFLKTM